MSTDQHETDFLLVCSRRYTRFTILSDRKAFSFFLANNFVTVIVVSRDFGIL